METLEFTIHRKRSYGLVVGTLIGVSLVEMAVVDALVRHSSAAAADVLLVLGTCAVLWLLADFLAMRRRPIVLDGDTLLVRVGLRRRARIPLRDIASIEAFGTAGEPRGERDYVRCTAFGPAELLLRLRSPARVEPLLGRSRVASRVGLAVDDEAAFERAVAGTLRAEGAGDEAERSP